MQQHKEQKFFETMTMLSTTFGATMNRLMFDAYWDALNKLSEPQLYAACKKAIAQCKFMPKPVELLELAGELSSSDRAARAWEAVCSAVRTHGRYTAVDFDDPLVNAAVRSMGGWGNLCGRDAKDFSGWARKEFIETYNDLARSPPRPEQCAALSGVYGSDNPQRIRCHLPPRETAGLRLIEGEVA